jgi:hypothetical protein
MSDSLERLLASLRTAEGAPDLGFGEFVLLLGASLIASLVVAYLYLQFYSSRATGSQVHLAFPLLAVAVTAIFLTIQFSLPLSLGLLGALSIVRFRTPIKESEEIAFIMLVIATSLACATFHLTGLLAILVVAVVALVARRFAPSLLTGASHDGSMVLALPSDEYAKRGEELHRYLQQRLRRSRVESISRTDGQVVVTMSFRAEPAAGIAALEQGLTRIVELRQLTIVYSRPGAL